MLDVCARLAERDRFEELVHRVGKRPAPLRDAALAGVVGRHGKLGVAAEEVDQHLEVRGAEADVRPRVGEVGRGAEAGGELLARRRHELHQARRTRRESSSYVHRADSVLAAPECLICRSDLM